jgi:hypothetical protein
MLCSLWFYHPKQKPRGEGPRQINTCHQVPLQVSFKGFGFTTPNKNLGGEGPRQINTCHQVPLQVSFKGLMSLKLFGSWLGAGGCELTGLANRGLLTARLAMQHIICAQGTTSAPVLDKTRAQIFTGF